MDILKDENNNYIKAYNPSIQFGKIDNDIVNIYMQYNQLKNIYRQGWLKIRIGLEHKEKCESIADHTFSVSMLAITIVQKYELKLDMLKVLKLAIMHELGEIYAGDYTPFDNITENQKHRLEKEAVEKLIKDITFENDFLETWLEYEEKQTEESKFVSELDKLEFLLQAVAYGYDVKYFKRTLEKCKSKYSLDIIEELIKISRGKKEPKIIG